MPTTLDTAVAKYLRSGNPAQRTREEYSTTLRKWARWGNTIPIENLGRKDIRAFLDWVTKMLPAEMVAIQGGPRTRSVLICGL